MLKAAFAARLADERVHTPFGKCGAVIGRDGVHHIRATAVDQHVGYRFRQRRAARNGIEMLVGGPAADVDQVEVGKTERTADHRTCDFDVVVAGELAHHRQRKARQCGEVGRNVDPRIVRDLVDDALDHFVEQRSFRFRVHVDSGEEQIGDLVQQVEALFRGALLGEILKFSKDQFRLHRQVPELIDTLNSTAEMNKSYAGFTDSHRRPRSDAKRGRRKRLKSNRGWQW